MATPRVEVRKQRELTVERKWPFIRPLLERAAGVSIQECAVFLGVKKKTASQGLYRQVATGQCVVLAGYVGASGHVETRFFGSQVLADSWLQLRAGAIKKKAVGRPAMGAPSLDRMMGALLAHRTKGERMPALAAELGMSLEHARCCLRLLCEAGKVQQVTDVRPSRWMACEFVEAAILENKIALAAMLRDKHKADAKRAAARKLDRLRAQDEDEADPIDLPPPVHRKVDAATVRPLRTAAANSIWQFAERAAA